MSRSWSVNYQQRKECSNQREEYKGPEARAQHIQGTESTEPRVRRLVRKKSNTEGEGGRVRSHRAW